MHIRSEYSLRNILGETIIVKQGKRGLNLTKIISLNPSSKLLYEELSGREFEIEDAVQVLKSHYKVESSLAEKDVREWIKTLQSIQVIDK